MLDKMASFVEMNMSYEPIQTATVPQFLLKWWKRLF